MLQDKHDQFEELGIENLTIDDKLCIVFLHRSAEPVRDVGLDIPVIHKLYLFLFALRLKQIHLSYGLFALLFVDKHVS